MSAIEIYVSTDIEVDGPIPGPHSMLSIGSAAFAAEGTLLATFSANLHALPGASGHPDTMNWWAGQPEAWAACRRDPASAGEGAARLCPLAEAVAGKADFCRLSGSV